ncbi:zinc protease [Iodobacter ciconiae]|uniref:Zinc protease n=1 Tax=Iodobacter ciconiae TaxID=2496266 RepID=A0A3S8ZNS7_9NEIS|nr:zinc protease [Iodobacter ciconiae]AZN35135.1 zinc protease [Iodobacter ciconiae]
MCETGGRSLPPGFETFIQNIATNRVPDSTVEVTLKEGESRPLTAGEIALAKLVFKDSINYALVKIHRGGLFGQPTKTGIAMTPNGEIYMPNTENGYKPDFSTERERDKVWLIHELTHVWQYQLGYDVKFYAMDIKLRGGYDGAAPAYHYDLEGEDTGKVIEQFNMEQQGQLIAHYFDAVYLEGTKRKGHADSLKRLPKLRFTLSSFLENPKNPALLPTTTGKIHWQ